MLQICNKLLAKWDLHPIYVENNFILEIMQQLTPRFDLPNLMILFISLNNGVVKTPETNKVPSF